MKDHSSNLYLRDGDREEIIRCLLELEEKPLESEQFSEPNNLELHINHSFLQDAFIKPL